MNYKLFEKNRLSMQNRKLSIIHYPLSIILILLFASCLKADLSPTQISTPPRDISLTWKTVADIRNLAGNNINTFKQITDAWWLEGVVISDDKQGNFYKQIYVQDSTGGIVIRINNNPLYPQFAFGRLIRVNLKNGYVQNYYGSIQLHGGLDFSNRPMAYTTLQVSKNFELYSFLNIEPQLVTPQELTNLKYRGALVKMNNFQVVEEDTSKTYSIASYYFIRIESNNTPRDTFYLNVNSNATFSNFNLPNGSGSIVGIYDTSTSTSPVRQPRQFFIRDTNDIQFYNPRF